VAGASTDTAVTLMAGYFGGVLAGRALGSRLARRHDPARLLTVALAPDQAVLASGRAVAVSSFAVVLAPLTVGTLADATSLTAALGVVPVALALAAVALTLVRRARTPASAAF
jgi:hypothetical protein